MLEKHSLKLIGENVRVRSFCPDLAKFLLNSYGLKCEAENNGKEEKSVNLLENRSPNGMVWWLETPTVGTGASLKSRVKSLISLSSSAANHAHLARLIKAHMLSDCLAGTQESKLTKLQRRLTGPAVQSSESHQLPKFTGTQVFYRDLIMYAENEAFRTHLKDALGSELCTLDATCMTNYEERSNLTSNDLTKEYLINLKKLRLLAKFMGFLIALPYATTFTEYTIKTVNAGLGGSLTTQSVQLPKEKVLETEIAIRNYKEKRDENELILDFLDLINEHILNEVCPFLKDVNNLLVTSRTSREKDSSFRHITPVTMSLNPADRIRNKEKELQARLEEELVRGQPSSTRRVLEMVSDRVTSATVKQLVACELNIARNQCRIESVAAVKVWQENDGRDTLKSLRSQAMDMASKTADARAGMALQALLANNTAKKPLESVAKRTSLARISKWIDDNWSSVGILCKDIEEEMKNLLILGENALQNNEKVKPNISLESMMLSQEEFDRVNASPSNIIINLKEQICLLLEYEEIENLTVTLEKAYACCKNTNIFKRPATTKALQQLTVELSIVYISRKPNDFENILEKLHSIWNENSPDRKPTNASLEAYLPERRGDLSPKFRNLTDEMTSSPPVSDDEGNGKPTRIVIAPVVIKNDETVKEPESCDDMLQYFDRILCPRNIVILSNSRCTASEVWDSMANFVVFLMRNNYLSEDSLTEQCLAVYRQDWPQALQSLYRGSSACIRIIGTDRVILAPSTCELQEMVNKMYDCVKKRGMKVNVSKTKNVLENLSNCMKAVSSQWGRSSGGKFTLFLDFLAEYCNDMDYEQDVSIMS
ncbi:Codanin-1 [Eumeta japonica]|uniref:Codanin-1 n=1 Tax=Eumeta variegata TaxID=151549 RepID=A0A4C1ZL10_EUMVA|nr:Codanin-1 [Eumeta japonica]